MTTAPPAPSERTVFNAIVQRQSVVTFRDELPPREIVEELLGAAVFAPNHHLSQPWRFFVLAGAARDQYAEMLAECIRQDATQEGAATVETRIAAERKKALRSPVIIFVASVYPDDSRGMDVEEVAATAAGVQNLLTAAPDLGLAAYWRTGAAAYDPRVKAFLGLRPEDHIVGLVYLGYPDIVRAPSPRRPAGDVTTWMGWEASA